MSKDEALKLALEALDAWLPTVPNLIEKKKAAITAIKQALAAQQEHEPENEPYVSLASVQEPVAWIYKGEPYFDGDKWHKKYELTDGKQLAFWKDKDAKPLYTTPPAQPAVPDALTSADIQEHIEYVAGWNDCRAEMLKGMK
jgi:hypothetical protein